MKFKWIKLIGYGGIYQGMKRKEILIDFTKANSRIIAILGDNGSGKSTLETAISIFPDDNSMFLKEYAEKSGVIIDRGIEYEFLFQHPVKEKFNKETGKVEVERLTTKAFIKKKISENDFLELNPNGTVNSYKDIIGSEFGLDSNFSILSSLSTENKGLVGKTPSERKKFVSAITGKTEIYNNINKALTKRNSVNMSMMNNLMAKIDSIGDEENVRNTLISVENRIKALSSQRDVLLRSIAEKDSLIKVLDPDLSIQNSYTAIQVELEHINSEMSKLENELDYIYSNNNLDSLNIDECTKLYKAYSTKVISLESLISELNSSIESMLTRREEESRSIQLKSQRLMSLKSEINYMDIENAIKVERENIAYYEKIFNDIHIKNAIEISKDEYVTGLNTLKDIKDMIDSFRSYLYTNTITDSISYIKSNVNVASMITNVEYELTKAEELLDYYSQQYTNLESAKEISSVLVNRPSKCGIDTCPFISEALKVSKSHPDIASEIADTYEKIQLLHNNINDLEKQRKELNECLIAIKDIKIILRSIDNNKSIIAKLPIGYIFLDTDSLLDRIANADQFLEINELYKFINYANIFEEYKVSKDRLYKLEIDYKIYESKNEVIEELNKDIAELEEKLSNIITDITNTNTTIETYKKEIDKYNSLIKILDTIIFILNKKKALKDNENNLNTRLNAISNNMERIQNNINLRERDQLTLNAIEKELVPLSSDRDKLKYGLQMLEQYREELSKITESYNTIEVIKKYSSPTKDGIQNLFVRVYMQQTLKLANEMLSLFFDGKLELVGYDIGENSFSIKCYSHYSNMELNDISMASRSEKTMASLCISAALLKQSSSNYNILKLDEIDEGLDSKNRLIFIQVLELILDMLGIEQCFIVSHSTELSLNSISIIKLRSTSNLVLANEGNIIFAA